MVIDKTDDNGSVRTKVIVSFRGAKVDVPLVDGTTVVDIKNRVIQQSNRQDNASLQSHEMKLLYKGKALVDDGANALTILTGNHTKATKGQYKMVAMGMSSAEIQHTQQRFQEHQSTAPRIRDDLTSAGRAETARRQHLGRSMMAKANRSSRGSTAYNGFGRIETLNLPHRNEAERILKKLASDPGVLACMAKHGWHVGTLAEMYPEGKVGESAVCIMGLNENKGQRILLRLRTDDLNGFRKELSIRKVLYHELAHNVHSEHNQDFFVLMRQIEKECTEMDWTNGEGISSLNNETAAFLPSYEGGTYRLGGGNQTNSGAASGGKKQNLSTRELASRAAMMRLTAEEEEIEQNCGCGKEENHQGKFLP